MSGLKRGGAAIVGAAESDLGQVADGLNPIDLMAQGIARAAADAGLRLRDIDGLLCATTQSRTSGLNLSEYLGISPRFIDTTILGGLLPTPPLSSPHLAGWHPADDRSHARIYPAHDRSRPHRVASTAPARRAVSVAAVRAHRCSHR